MTEYSSRETRRAACADTRAWDVTLCPTVTPASQEGHFRQRLNGMDRRRRKFDSATQGANCRKGFRQDRPATSPRRYSRVRHFSLKEVLRLHTTTQPTTGAHHTSKYQVPTTS
jgi:hypothetical protein